MRQRLAFVSACVMVVGCLASDALAQGGPPQGPGPSRQAAGGPDAARVIPDGGVFAPGWTGKVDAAEAAAGQVLTNSRLSKDGNVLRVATGPAATYWNPANTASGSYTVKATFTEPKYMNANSHPHPYGIVIGGNDLGTPRQSYLYCSAYGNGTFIVRGFTASEDPARDSTFSLISGRRQPHDAVNKAAGPGQPVTQEIAMTVTPDNVSCAINGKVVATYPKSDVVQPGRLKSTDGVYGIRFAHNTEATVTGLAVTK